MSKSKQESNTMGTRKFGEPNAAPMPHRETSPLDLQTPVKLRFVLDDLSSVFEVPVKDYMVIGRKTSPDDKQVDIDLSPHGAGLYGVSRYHAIIQVVNKRVSIKDFNSTNGTLLNNFVLTPMYAYRLRHGDEISFGKMTMKVHFVGVEALAE